MRTIRKTFKIGESTGITIDKDICKKMKIEFGDRIVIDVIRNLKDGGGIKPENDEE